MRRYITAGLVSVALLGAQGVAAVSSATASARCPDGSTVLWPAPPAPGDPNRTRFDVNRNGTVDVVLRAADGTVRAQDSGSHETWTVASTAGRTAVVRGDFNGDGTSDLLARTSTGLLDFYAGDECAQGRTASPVPVAGTAGWNQFSRLVSAGDLDQDGANDLLAQWPTGELYLYRGKARVGTGGAPGLYPAVHIASGWNRFDRVVPLGDVTRDGRPDMLGIDSATGNGLFYAGNAAGRYDYRGAAFHGLKAVADVTSVGDVDRNGRPDILVRVSPSDTTMRVYSADYGTLPTFGDTGTSVPAAALGSAL